MHWFEWHPGQFVNLEKIQAVTFNKIGASVFPANGAESAEVRDPARIEALRERMRMLADAATANTLVDDSELGPRGDAATP